MSKQCLSPSIRFVVIVSLLFDCFKLSLSNSKFGYLFANCSEYDRNYFNTSFQDETKFKSDLQFVTNMLQLTTGFSSPNQLINKC